MRILFILANHMGVLPILHILFHLPASFLNINTMASSMHMDRLYNYDNYNIFHPLLYRQRESKIYPFEKFPKPLKDALP